MKLSRRRVKLANDRYCFSAGDLRCNEQLELTVLHTVEWMCNCILLHTIFKDPSCNNNIFKVWMREHNKVARELSQIQPDWDDEILYQEARWDFNFR